MTLTEIKQKYLNEALGRPIAKYCIKNRNGNIVAQSEAVSPYIFIDDEDVEWALEHYSVKERFKNSEGKMLTSFAMKPSESGLYRSVDGKYYTEEELPENGDAFCTERYSNEVKFERNARISDTDDYVRLPDITVQSAAKAKRAALTDKDRAELETYRQELRDLPSAEVFPFVDWPEFPSALAYELEQKVASRQQRLGAFK